MYKRYIYHVGTVGCSLNGLVMIGIHGVVGCAIAQRRTHFLLIDEGGSQHALIEPFMKACILSLCCLSMYLEVATLREPTEGHASTVTPWAAIVVPRRCITT